MGPLLSLRRTPKPGKCGPQEEDSGVTDRIAKTLTSPDGRCRLDIFRRQDGLFGFRQMVRYERPQGSYWAPSVLHKTITDTAERAEREARSCVPWLIEISK